MYAKNHARCKRDEMLLAMFSDVLRMMCPPLQFYSSHISGLCKHTDFEDLRQSGDSFELISLQDVQFNVVARCTQRQQARSMEQHLNADK